MAKRLATIEELIDLKRSVFEKADPCDLEVWLDIAGTMINVKVWRAKASHGHRLLAAHLYTSATSGAGSDILTSVKVGPVSKSFAVKVSDDAELGSTRWGKMYLAMRRTLVRTPVVVSTTAAARRQFRG